MFSVLIAPRILSLKNSITFSSVMRRSPFILMGIGLWVLFYIGTRELLSHVREIEMLGDLLAEKLFSLIFLSLSGFLVLSNIVTGLSSFYLSRDIPFLLSKPVETEDITRLKTFDSLLNSSWMVAAFIPPVFIAYGTSYHAPAAYYFMSVSGLIMFIIIAGGIGISAAHIITRLFPARRSRETLLALGLLLFVLLYFAIRKALPRNPGGPDEIIASLIRLKSDSPFLPGFWLTRSLFPLLKGRGMDLFYPALLASNAAFFLLLASFTGNRLYRMNIEKIQPSGQGAGNGLLKNICPGRKSAFLYKDLRIFFRDTGQWSQIFIIGALIVVYVYNFRSAPIEAISGLSPFFREIMVLINMAMAGLVLSAVAARFLYTSVSLEGQAFWIIRSAPVDTGNFLWKKFLLGAVPLTLIISLLVFLTDSALGVGGSLMAVTVGTTVILSLSVSGLGTGLGAVYPKFRYENIAAVSMSLGSMAFMLMAFCLVIATISLEARAYYILEIRRSTITIAGQMQVVGCVILALLLNASAFFFPMRIGKNRLERNTDF